MRRLTVFILTAAAAILAFIANISAAGACHWWAYQPAVPKKLLK